MKCRLHNDEVEYDLEFDCQRDAVDFLIDYGVAKSTCNKENVISKLKREQGYKGWHISQIK